MKEGIVSELDTLFGTYVAERGAGEPFGDFTMRKIFKIADYNYSI